VPDFFKKNKFIVILLFAVFLLRIPSLFEPYWYGDETIYLTLGLAIKKGLLLYRDIFDNKTPLIYLVAALANGTLFWFKFILTLSVLATIFLFYQLSQKFFTNSPLSVYMATFAFALMTTFRLFEGNIANAEIFILLPTLLGFYLLSPVLLTAKPHSPSPAKAIAVGTIFGLGFLFKVTALFDFLVLIAFFLFFKEKRKIINLGKKEIFLSLGYLVPIFITGLFFLLKGSFAVFFKSCFLQTMGYLSSWKTGSHTLSLNSLLKTDLGINVFLVVLFFLFLWLLKRKISQFSVLLIVWVLLSLFGSSLSGRPYPHYLMQTVPAFALVIGLFFTQKRENILVSSLLIFLLGLTAIRYRYWGYNSLTYYQNFFNFMTKKIDKTAYFSYFNSKTPEIYQLRKFPALELILEKDYFKIKSTPNYLVFRKKIF